MNYNEKNIMGANKTFSVDFQKDKFFSANL